MQLTYKDMIGYCVKHRSWIKARYSIMGHHTRYDPSGWLSRCWGPCGCTIDIPLRATNSDLDFKQAREEAKSIK